MDERLCEDFADDILDVVNKYEGKLLLPMIFGVFDSIKFTLFSEQEKNIIEENDKYGDLPFTGMN